MAELELKDEVTALKEQMSKVLEVLQSLEKNKNIDGASSAVNEEPQATPSHPPGFSPAHLHYGLNSQGMLVPLSMYQQGPTQPPLTNPQDTQTPQFPPYGLPPGYTPPFATNSLENNLQPPAAVQNSTQPPGPDTSTETPQVQVPSPIFMAPSGYVPPQGTNSQNFVQPQVIHLNSQGNSPSSYPVIVHPYANAIQNFSTENPQSKAKLQILEERLRAVEGGGYYGLGDASDLCLVPNVVIPPKFKVPDFDRYKGTTCPRSHLTMYCRKMAAYAHDEKLLIHFFQDSLTGAASSWYTHLDRTHVRCWKDLADAFLKQYKYNIDMAPDRMQLQNMVKRDNETFKEYAQRWRGLAAQVEPPLSEKEMVAMFIDTLHSPFYDRMIGSVSSNFSDMVIIGERVEGGMRSGKIAYSAGANNAKKSPMGFTKKKEGETHAVMSGQGGYTQGKSHHFQANFQQPYLTYPQTATTPQIQYSQSNQQRPPNNQEKKPVQFDPIPMSYTELFRDLLRNQLISPIPTKPLEPPFPKWYDPNAKCEFHAGVAGHSTENCRALKFKVQGLINAKWLSFTEDSPNVSKNPLPGHESSSVNMVEELTEQLLVKKVEEIRTPMRVIFAQLCKLGMIEVIYKEDETCGFHPSAEHTIEECSEFKQILQSLMEMHLIQISCMKSGEDVLTLESDYEKDIPFPKPLEIHYTKKASTEGSSVPTLFPKPLEIHYTKSIPNEGSGMPASFPKPLEIRYTKKTSMNVPGAPRPITIQVPTPFPYKDTKAVPWRYDVKVHGGNYEEDQLKSGTSSITNISGPGGMTRSGRIYTPEELRKEKGKEKEVDAEIMNKTKKQEYKRTISDDEAGEFLRYILQSEYKVVDQLNHTPAKISVLSLLLNSEPHRKALMKVLNEAHVTHDITVNQFDGIIGNITANNHIAFNDDEVPAEGMGHNKALHISVKCQDHILARVLIDNGSSLNVMPKSTLMKLPVDGSYMKPSTMIVRAFDGSRREVIDEIELPIQIGPCTFEVVFQVMDITPAYSCLLGRRWIHPAGAVPSTLHQKLKFIVDNKLVIISAEEDLLVSQPSSTRYIEAAEEALETSFQALEIANATFVGEGTPIIKPQLSGASMMSAKVMLEGGLWKKLGKLLKLWENKDKFGLGYKPSKADRRRIASDKKEKRMARLENREAKTEGVPICDIQQSFRSAGFIYVDQVAAADDDHDAEDGVNLVYPCPPNEELGNWEIVELPVIFDSLSK